MTTIDWSKEIGTMEDSPRPVRVLAQFDWNGEACTLVEMPSGLAMAFTAEGKNVAAGVYLRNVPPPKPEPVLREAWVVWDADGAVLVFTDEMSAKIHGGVYARAAVMSDGSPVEEDPVRYGVCETCVEKAVKSSDEWRTKAEALQVEVNELSSAGMIVQLKAENKGLLSVIDRMRPVVDAAVACVHAGPVMMSGAFNMLVKAVRAAQQTEPQPKDPDVNADPAGYALEFWRTWRTAILALADAHQSRVAKETE